MLTSIDRLMIATDDLEQAQRQCIALLGRSPSWVGEYPGMGVRHVLFCLANTRIELLAPSEETQSNADLRAHLEEHGPGLYGIALETGDLGSAIEKMRKADLELDAPASLLVQDAASGAYRRLLQTDLATTLTRGIRISLVESTSQAELLPPALPLAEDSASARGLDHVVIGTQDPEHAISLYRDRLGIRLALDRTFEARGIRLLFFRLGGATLEFSLPVRTGAELDAGDESTDRLWGIAYQVPDAERAYARLEQAGFELTGIRDGHKRGTRVFTVKAEPLGVPTLMIQPVAAEQ